MGSSTPSTRVRSLWDTNHPYHRDVTEFISSTKNPIVRSFVRLHRQKERRATSQILIEGPTVFDAAMKAGAEPVAILALEDDAATRDAVSSRRDVTLHTVTEHVLTAASDTSHPRSPVAIFKRPAPGRLSDRNVVVLFDLADPGNVGTIIRTAAALGWDVAVTSRTADVWSPKVLRSGAGTHFDSNIIEIDSFEAMFAGGPYSLVAAVVTDGEEAVRTSGQIALLIGNEAHGLPADVFDRADVKLTIPMPGGAESLNAAVAAALGMWICMGSS